MPVSKSQYRKRTAISKNIQKQALESTAGLELVSVVIPAYNAARYIERTLASVLCQTYQNLEIIVVDDGSQDETSTLVQAIAQQDWRVQLLQQSNQGVASARNAGINHARGRFIAPLDADDIWYPHNIEKQVKRLQIAGPNVGVCYAWSIDIDSKEQPIGNYRAAAIEGSVYRSLICHNFIGNASATVIRRSALSKVGCYDITLKHHEAQGCEDWDLYLRLANKYQYCFVPDFLIGYRKAASSMSANNYRMSRSHKMMLQAVKKAHPEIPSFLYKLSKSSFYMYLARQSDLAQNYRETLYWLKRAVVADCVTPLGRYGLYTMALRSMYKLLRKRTTYNSAVYTCTANVSQTFEKLQPESRAACPSAREEFSLAVIEHDYSPSMFSLKFKLWLGIFLHRVLQ